MTNSNHCDSKNNESLSLKLENTIINTIIRSTLKFKLPLQLVFFQVVTTINN